MRHIGTIINPLMLFALAMLSCNERPEKQSITSPSSDPLPFFGEHDVEMKAGAQGEMITDTIYYRLPYFSFTNQDGKTVSHKDYEGKVFVADFFFTHCESICPIMSTQMVRLQEKLKKEGLSDKVWLLSHTVDPMHDQPDTLKAYARSIGADLSTWNFVTGESQDIYWQAETGYMLSAFPSDTAQGGFFHTDRFTLLDRSMRIRGYYDGTSTKSVDQLFEDIKRLVADEYPANP
jgi:protein SCO1/2